MIHFRNIHKRFGKLQVLNGCTLELHSGRVIALIGPNGGGKSTLMKCLLQLVNPDSGEIFFQEELIVNSSAYRSKIGYMPQIGRYPEQMTIRQLFAMMSDLRGIQLHTDHELYDAFGLAGIQQKKLGALSGGTRQKVSAALAFLFNPQVLIVDEPTAGLDPVSSEIFKEKIKKARSEGKLVLITTHNLSEVDELADEVVFLHEGVIRFHHTVSALLEQTKETSVSRAVARMTKDIRYD